jgi:predicted acetyltransferase
MQNNIQFRDITPLDENVLVELYDKVWPETAGIRQGKTKWMLSSAVFYGICACDDKKIVGSRPSFYSNVYYGNRKLNTVQCGNSCVDSDYRRYGIFSKMNSLFLNKFFGEKNNDLIYNVSVYISKMAYQKLGWVYINSLTKLTYFANIRNIIWKTKLNIKKITGNETYRKTDIPDLADFDEKLLDVRENYFRKTLNIHTFYDKDFFRWRLNSDSNIALLKIENTGTVIYKTGDKNGLRIIKIGEVFLYEYNKQNFKKAIKVLIQTFQADILEIAITEQHPCYHFYKKVGFITNPFKKYLNLGVKVVSEEMKQICLNPANWALSTIDIDTF